ncbi:hypothetical protein [Phycobacter sp. K97]|uniref:hypothetical protein n=1 Tax=Phycobacter sedimenti TaxID=3133977 RepID=UPI00311FFE36
MAIYANEPGLVILFAGWLWRAQPFHKSLDFVQLTSGGWHFWPEIWQELAKQENSSPVCCRHAGHVDCFLRDVPQMASPGAVGNKKKAEH